MNGKAGILGGLAMGGAAGAAGGGLFRGAGMVPGGGMLGMAATYAGPIAILAGFGKMIKAGSEFESKLVDIAGLLSTSKTFTPEGFQALEKYMIELGKKSIFRINQVAGAIEYMAMAGLDMEKITPALPAVTNIAAVGRLPIERAADIITNIQTGYGVPAQDLINVADIMTGVFTRTNTKLEEQGESFSYAGNLASQYGLDFKEVAVAIGLMGNAGIKGSRAGTNLRQMFLRLAAPTGGALEVMKKYNLEFLRVGENGKASLKPLREIGRDIQNAGLNATDLKKLFSVFGGQAFGAIFTQKDVETGEYLLEILTKQMDQVQGLSQKLADAKMKTFDGRVLEMQSRLEALSITFDKRVKPALKGFVEGIIKMVDYLNGPGFFIFKQIGRVFSVLGNVFYQVGKGIKNVFEFVRQHKAVFEPIINTGLILTGIASTLSIGMWTLGGAFAFVRFAAWPVVLLFKGLWWLTSTLLVPAIVSLSKAFWTLMTTTPVGWVLLLVAGIGVLYEKVENVRYSFLSFFYQLKEIGAMAGDIFSGPGSWIENFKNLDIEKRLIEADLKARVFSKTDDSKISTLINNQVEELTNSMTNLTAPLKAIGDKLKPKDIEEDPSWKQALQGPLGFTKSPLSSNLFDLDGNGDSDSFGAGGGSNDAYTISGPSATGRSSVSRSVIVNIDHLLKIDQNYQGLLSDDGKSLKPAIAEALIEVVRDVELGLSN